MGDLPTEAGVMGDGHVCVDAHIYIGKKLHQPCLPRDYRGRTNFPREQHSNQPADWLTLTASSLFSRPPSSSYASTRRASRNGEEMWLPNISSQAATTPWWSE